jgi:signal transduction histidine kinase
MVTVVDGRGTVVASTDRRAAVGTSRKGDVAIDRALGAAAEGHTSRADELAVFRNLASYQSLRGVRWAIVLTQPERDAYAVAAATRRLTLLVAVIALALALAVGAFLAARLTRPLAALATRADAIAHGDTAPAPPIRGPGEVGVLGARIEEMAGRIGERAELQAALARGDRLASVGVMAAQVAHEINNPLTTVLGYAALLAEDKPADHADRAGLELIADEATRMKAIVAGLLGYARAETAGDRATAVAPGEIGRLVAALLAPAVRKAQATLTVTLDDAPAIGFDGHALQQVLVNLVTNAHAAPGGAITGLEPAARRPDRARRVRRRPRRAAGRAGPGVRPVRHHQAGRRRHRAGLAVRATSSPGRRGDAVDDAPAGGARFRLTVATAPVVPPAEPP